MDSAINLDPESAGMIYFYLIMFHMEKNWEMVSVSGDKLLDDKLKTILSRPTYSYLTSKEARNLFNSRSEINQYSKVTHNGTIENIHALSDTKYEWKVVTKGEKMMIFARI